MATEPGRDLTGLLESAAPTPRIGLDIGGIRRRAHRRRGRRRVVLGIASVLVVGLFVGLVAQVVGRRDPHTVIAGPPSSRRIPLDFGAGTATTEIGLLDGTRLRLSLPEAVGRGLAGMTFADLEYHGSIYAGPAPHGWRIDVAVGSMEKLVPGGEPLVVPPSARAGAGTVDRPGHRLGLQFGSWALVASGDSLTDADLGTLLAGVALAETPDGFLEYRGSLRLWLVDGADARLGGSQTAVSVFLSNLCPPRVAPRPTAGGLESYPTDNPDGSPGADAELCDRANPLTIRLHTSRPLTDGEIDRVRVQVVSVGSTLAALRRGEHP